jgi:hypothetical protein
VRCGTSGPSSFTSPTTPTTSRNGVLLCGKPCLIRFPSGLSFGHHFRAIDSLMMATGTVSAVSISVKYLPASSGISIVRKKLVSATLNRELGKSICAGAGCPSTTYTELQQSPTKGAPRSISLPESVGRA